jgi:hypothetical protein
MENNFRNLLKGTENTGTDKKFSLDPLGLNENLKSPRKENKKKNPQAYRMRNTIF